MTDVASQAAAILAELKNKGSEKTRSLYARHGHAPERTFGVNVADIKPIAKRLKGQQETALALYDSGIMEAMYLAGMVANGAHMSAAQLHAWARRADGLSMISDHTVPWVTVENAHGRELALEWIDSEPEFLAASGWCTYSGLAATVPDARLSLDEIEELLGKAIASVHTAQNRVRLAMNGFVISVGIYVEPLAVQAKAAARKIGPVSADVGDTACQIPLATAYIAKVEAAGKLFKKRKTIRC